MKRKSPNGVLRALLAACLIAPAGGALAAEGGILTLTFDDASRTQYEAALPLIREFKVPGTLFVISGKAAEAARHPGAWGMDWREIAQFRDAGWEIGAHTDSHPDLTQLSDPQLRIELDVANDEIAAHLGVTPVSFASPFGEYDERTLAEIMRRYSYHVGAYGGAEGRNAPGNFDRARISRMGIDVRVSAAAVCSEAEKAAQEGTWLVLMFHGFQEQNPGDYQTAPSAFREMLSCATRLSEAGRLRILTLKDAMQALGPS